MQIRVEGFQWQWTFLYLQEGIFVAGKTLVRPAEMVVPVDEPVKITLTSRDVIHSFFVPDLLFKRDAIPGRTSTFEFTPTELGTFPAQCAEFCGLWHSKMTFDVKVVSSLDYQAWIKQQRKAAAEHHVQARWDDPVARRAQHLVESILPGRPREHTLHRQHHNQDAGIEHNFAIYDSFFQKTTFFTGPKVTGPATELAQLPIRYLPAATTSSATSTGRRCRGRSSSRDEEEMSSRGTTWP